MEKGEEYGKRIDRWRSSLSPSSFQPKDDHYLHRGGILPSVGLLDGDRL